MTIMNGGAAEPRTLRTRRALDQGWWFRQAGHDNWLPARVPGSNFTDLLRNGLIEDPFFGDNEPKLQWIEQEDWEYQFAFEVAAADLDADALELVFEGLDTYCAISLNGVPLFFARNMFCAHRIDCKGLLRPGANQLTLRFQSPVKAGAKRRAKEGFRYPAENDKTPDKASVYVRKAPYHFGWDWGPKYVTSGVWRPVWLDVVRKGRIRECAHTIRSLSDERAEIAFTVEVEGFGAGEGWIELSCDVRGVEPVRVPVSLEQGVRTQSVLVAIDEPRLWWPNGLGEPFLYRFRIALGAGESLLDEAPLAIGLRTIEVVNEPDEHGESFFVKVNGRPVFMKGANYIPLDSFQERVTPERYRQLFRDAADANMNMLRVWGGGIYEPDTFYDLADEHGILIWQDFMFACTLYPSDEEFLGLVAEEARQVVKRLRHHACLALWCGNNEISLGIAHWDWPEKFGYSPELFARLVAGNARLFEELLPAIVRELDPGRFYFPSSPIGFWNDPADDGRGDGHYWGVWHGELPFSTYAERLSRFMSEYGFQSYPLLETIEHFTKPEDRDAESAALGIHQKHPRGNAIISRSMRETYGEPATFEHFCYLSQLLQADGLRVAFEAHRRAMPFCMGSLYWQLNDCWPSISWSSIDYCGRWKAHHYQAARSFAPLLLSAAAGEGGYHVHGVSDLREAVSGTLALEVVSLDGTTLWSRELEVTIEGNRSALLHVIEAPELSRGNGLLAMRLTAGGAVLAANSLALGPMPVSVLPEPGLRLEVVDDSTVRVRAERFARGVYVSAEGEPEALNFSDNFFDLLPGEARTVKLRDGRFDPATVRVMSAYDVQLAVEQDAALSATGT